MKCVQSNKLDFSGQNIYVGIDVHLKSWSVAILSDHSVLKRFSQSPEPEALHKYLVINYPGANYFSVYEAGFCGFWIHERLTDLGITNIVVNPADVPTMSKEKLRKTDAVDCNKLARELRSGSLVGIYVRSGNPGTSLFDKDEKPDSKRQHPCQEPYQVSSSFSWHRDTGRVYPLLHWLLVQTLPFLVAIP